jgi:diguanylate cyclase (GGDEF)-like protein
MAQAHKLGWGVAAAVLAVMVLLFAALVSSWHGLDAEAEGRRRVEQATQLERDVADARAQAATVVALQAELALYALRGEAAESVNARGTAYRAAVQSLRQRLERVRQAQLLPGERALLDATREAIDRVVEVHDRGAARLRAQSRTDKLVVANSLLDTARPLADSAAEHIGSLERLVAARAADAAQEADAAAQRARTLLVVFGGLSLLLALVLARTLAQSLARRTELMAQLAQLARVDALTGVGNRRTWDEELVRGHERARRTGRACSVGLIDLDHFKRYNDAHGHLRGDALLRTAAQAFATRLRGDDLIARYGGEEFSVLLHGCDRQSALVLFERMQNILPAGQTFSAGVADTDGREDPAQVLARADAALYRAKELGRNRTVAAADAALRSAA